MSFWRNSSYPVFAITLMVIAGALGLARDYLIGRQLQEEIGGTVPRAVPELADEQFVAEMERLQALRVAEEIAAIQDDPDLTPEEQRQRTLSIVEAAIAAGEPLPNAIPVAAVRPSSPSTSPDGRIQLKHIGYQPEVQPEPLGSSWLPLIAAVAGGGTLTLIGVVGALIMLRRSQEPQRPADPHAPLVAPPPPPPFVSDASTLSPHLTAQDGRRGGFTDEDVLRAMKDAER